MAINRINETDLRNKLVSQLSNRPTDPRSAGGDNMTAQEVKARHDALGLLVKDKLNELLDALNNATVNGEPVTPLADLITVVADGVSKSLTEWIEAKLTKSTAAGDGIHAYGVDNAGEQTMLPVSDAATEGAIPQYGTGGVLPVADGTADGHAMNKGQVDALVDALTAAITAKYTKPAGGIPLADLASSVAAVISDALKWSNADASATPAKLVMRDFNGVAYGATYGASASGTALVNKEQFEPVKELAEGANKAFSVASYSALATALNAATSTAYKVGQSIYVATEDVPDVWVYSVEDSSVSYTYTTDSAFEAALVAGTLQIGYYTLRPLETEKVDLTGYATEPYVGNAISGNIDATLSTTGKSADAKAVGDAIDALIDALVDGVIAVAEATYAESATYAQQADLANQINTDREIEDADTACPPVVFGTVGGNAEVQSGLMKFPELRGHTIKWNQLVQNGNFADTSSWTTSNATISVSDNTCHFQASIPSGYIQQMLASTMIVGHKYLITASLTHGIFRLTDNTHDKFISKANLPAIYTAEYAFDRIRLFDDNDTTEIDIRNVMIFDITDTDYSSVLEFVRDFPKPYYPYNAGTLLSSKSSSVDFVKRNQWDEEWEAGILNSDGTVSSGSRVCSKNYIPVLPGATYFCTVVNGNNYVGRYAFYDANKNLVEYSSDSARTLTVPVNAVYLKFCTNAGYGSTYLNDICIYVNWDTPGLPYVAYSKQHITLPNIELRSVGDVYDVAYQTGGGKRRIGERAYQSGDENDPDVLTDGTTTLYVLATETDITVEENPGWDEYAEIENFGTVKFNQDPAQTIPVPQAYFVRYVVNLVEFLDSLYVHCGGDVSKLALVE